MKSRILQHSIAVILGLGFFAPTSYAQQVPVYYQYMLNSFMLNPAVAGFEDVTEASLAAREQWLGAPERPRSYSLTFQTRIFQSRNFTSKRLKVRRGRSGEKSTFFRPSMGIGGAVYNDINARLRRTGAQASYSYIVYAGKYMLSIGLGLSLQQYSADVSQQDTWDPEVYDKTVSDGKPSTGFAPDASLGFLLSHGPFYAGASASNLVQNAISFGKSNPLFHYRQLRQYHLMGGYRMTPGQTEWSLEPSVVAVVNERPGWMLDLNLRWFYQDRFWAGVSYRTRNNIVIMGGMRYRRYIVSYAYEYGIGSHNTARQTGSHEVVLGFRMGDLDRHGHPVRTF